MELVLVACITVNPPNAEANTKDLIQEYNQYINTGVVEAAGKYSWEFFGNVVAHRARIREKKKEGEEEDPDFDKEEGSNKEGKEERERRRKKRGKRGV